MGYYVNLPDTKGFLDKNAIRVVRSEVEKFFDRKYDFYDHRKVVICAVDNFAFTAYAVVYSVEEFNAFSRESDTRLKYWYFIDKNVLINSGGIDSYTIEMLRNIES